MKNQKVAIKVIFDSSAIFIGSASDLVSPSIVQLIQNNSKHPDLEISWHLPKVVVDERRYQMIKRGYDLLPNIQKLEKLLGHQINITGDIIEKRVDDVIREQLKLFNISVINLDTAQVDWEQVVMNSVFRKPPFEAGEKEKGFRDAIIVESFAQLLSSSPKSLQYCRLVLVTGDDLLAKAASDRSIEAKNIQILKNSEELQSLINTLASTVSEELIKLIKSKASSYFFEPQDKNVLYQTGKIKDIIKTKFAEKLLELPEGAEQRENGTWYIGSPGFVKKVGQRITWATPIRIEAKAFKNQAKGIPSSFGNAEQKTVPNAAGAEIENNKGTILTSPLSSLVELFGTERVLIAEGNSLFVVQWSHILTTNNKLRSPKIEDVKFNKTIWNDK